MHKLSRQQSNLQLLPAKNLTNVDDMTTKLAGIGSARGTGPAALNWLKFVGNTDVFCFGFIL